MMYRRNISKSAGTPENRLRVETCRCAGSERDMRILASGMIGSTEVPLDDGVLMHARLALSGLLLLAAPLGAQTVYTGFTQNPGCVVNGPNMCAQKIAPQGAALTARNAFFGQLANNVATQNFESFAPGLGAPLALDFGFAGIATLTGAGNVEAEDPVDIIPFGRMAISGSQYYQTRAAGVANFSIVFSQQVAGFGFYGIDFGDVGGSVGLDLFSGGSMLSSLVIQPQVAPSGTFVPELNGGLRFWGVLFGSNAIDRVDFTLTGLPDDADVFAFDDLTVADASQVQSTVPEPATFALMAAGLLGVLAVTRRRVTNR